jgi:tetratricopeptide (TPR) repeat protein
MAQKRREDAVRAAQEAASIAAALNEPERGRRRRGHAVPERIADVAGARDVVENQLRRKRGAEAAALLQRLAQEIPGRETADLALDCGDRCMALGQSRSATNCFLAGWRADPAYEAPLWRLADVCLADREVDLATGYLERIAELMRSRGDDPGALAVYRKIVTVAPDREDIRKLVRLAQSTGRFE